jgi:outer membrane protein
VLEPQISGMKEQIARTEKEVEIGNRAKSDVYDIKANFGTIQEQWISAQNQMNISKINLLAALNINKDSIDFVSDENSEITPNFINSKEMIDNLVQKNPIFIENQKELEAAKMKIKAAKSDYLPTISAQYQWSSFFNKNLKEDLTTNFSTQFNQNKNSQVSIGLNVPLFQKFQVKNAVETAKLDQQYTVFENQRKLNELYKTLNIIAEQYDNAIEKNKILQQNFENQKLSFERSEEKYKEGLMDAYTFFVVRNSWLQANFNLNASKFDVMQQQALINVFENNN